MPDLPDPARAEATRLGARMRQLRHLKDALMVEGMADLLTPEGYAAALARLAEETLHTLEAFARWQEAHVRPPPREEEPTL